MTSELLFPVEAMPVSHPVAKKIEAVMRRPKSERIKCFWEGRIALMDKPIIGPAKGIAKDATNKSSGEFNLMERNKTKADKSKTKIVQAGSCKGQQVLQKVSNLRFAGIFYQQAQAASLIGV
jgi:hypothetical protein